MHTFPYFRYATYLLKIETHLQLYIVNYIYIISKVYKSNIKAKDKMRPWNPEETWWPLTLSRDLESVWQPLSIIPNTHKLWKQAHREIQLTSLFLSYVYSDTHIQRVMDCRYANSISCRAEGRRAAVFFSASCVWWSLQTRTQQLRHRALNNTTDACLFI